eukprot:7756964-Pyramimonas_sp.AAC.1
MAGRLHTNLARWPGLLAVVAEVARVEVAELAVPVPRLPPQEEGVNGLRDARALYAEKSEKNHKLLSGKTAYQGLLSLLGRGRPVLPAAQ